MTQPLKEPPKCLHRQLLEVVSVVVAPEPSPTIKGNPMGFKGTRQLRLVEEGDHLRECSPRIITE